MVHFFSDVQLLLLMTVSMSCCSFVKFINFNKCFKGNYFHKLNNVSFERCRLACQFRRRCKAGNYWRIQKRCDLIDTDGSPLELVDTGQTCVSIARSDLPEVAACLPCGDEHVCDPANNECPIQECQRLTVDKGTVKGNRLQVGSRVKVTCQQFYRLQPVGSITICQEDRSWAVLPQCVLEITCGSAPTVSNSVLQSSLGDGEPGTVLTYACKNGHGSPPNKKNYVVTCQTNEQWTTVGFECRIMCPDPDDLDNASLDAGSKLVGTTRTYTCFNYYITNTGANLVQVTCTNTGQWSTPTGACLRNCGSPPVFPNAAVSSGNTIEGSVRLYTCTALYTIKKNGVVTTDTTDTAACLSSGSWQWNFECVLDCSDPSPVNFASLSAGGTLLGSVRTYTCFAHYITSSGSTTITTTCTSTGQWSTPAETCLRECPTPPAVTNGIVSPGTVYEGSVRTYTCDSGYIIKENGVLTTKTSSTLTCLNTGMWSGTIECVLDCPVALVTGTHGIGNSQITASSSYGIYGPKFGRLDNSMTWIAGSKDFNQYIQFQFPSSRTVNTVITQGSPYVSDYEWVTGYKLLYSTDCAVFTYHSQFVGNTDANTKVSHDIVPAIQALCVKINPRGWNVWPAMRVELMGCF